MAKPKVNSPNQVPEAKPNARGKQVEKNTVALSVLKIEQWPIEKLHANDYNPNRQNPDEFAMLKKSIMEDGFTQPVLCQADGTIIDGFHRWSAVKSLYADGVKKIGGLEPGKIGVVVTNMTEAQRRIATIRHNEARGNEDMALLGQLMQDLEKLGAGDWAKDSLGLDNEGFNRLINYNGTVLDEFPGEEPGPAWEPQPTQPGQVESYRKDDGSEAQSVSAGASAPAAPTPNSSVPGLGVQDKNYTPPAVIQVRRIFVMTKDEAAIVDKVLGANAAARLVEICRGMDGGSEKKGEG